jgi:putative acetyltransferase
VIVIRPEGAGDIVAIRHVNEQAFGRADEADLVDRLRRSGKAVISLVAEADGEIVGHILFSTVLIETRAGPATCLGLAPMAVLPGHQRKGIGGRLVRAGLDRCRDTGHTRVIVLGHPDYYPRFGFEPAGRHGIVSEYDAPDEAFMVLALVDGALDGVSGTARYQPEFNET